MKRSFVLSILTLMGTVIGAGVFALPHMFARLGIWPASFLFGLFILLVAVTHTVFVDVILEVPGNHRLPGYVRRFLGGHWAALATMTHVIQVYGAHIIYLLLGGAFIQALLFTFAPAWSRTAGILTVFILGVIAVSGGVRRLTRIEAWATALMAMLFITASVFVLRQPPAITTFVPSFSWSAFGLFLFALSGLPVVSEVVELNHRRRDDSHHAVVWGTIGAGIIMWFFAFAFARFGGTLASQDPRSLVMLLPAWAAFVIPLLGLLAIGTSYITTAEDIQVMWRRDYGFRERSAWFLALLPPLVCALLMTDGFVLLATILGTVCGGINGIMIGMMRLAELERGKRLTLALAVAIGIVFIYAFGLAGQLTTWLLV